MRYLKSFNESATSLDAKSLIPGHRYKITSLYCEEDEDPISIVDVEKKHGYGYIFKDVEHQFSYERSFHFLSSGHTIEEITLEEELD